MKDEQLFDVIAVNLKTGEQRFIDQRKTEKLADAVINMAVFRRGVDEEFFVAKPHPHTLEGPRK